MSKGWFLKIPVVFFRRDPVPSRPPNPPNSPIFLHPQLIPYNSPSRAILAFLSFCTHILPLMPPACSLFGVEPFCVFPHCSGQMTFLSTLLTFFPDVRTGQLEVGLQHFVSVLRFHLGGLKVLQFMAPPFPVSSIPRELSKASFQPVFDAPADESLSWALFSCRAPFRFSKRDFFSPRDLPVAMVATWRRSLLW